MGVPGFLSWVTRNHPSIVRSVGNCVKPTINCFFIDFPSLVHCAFNYVDLKKADILHDVISLIVMKLDSLIHAVQPTNLIYISIDGAVPFSKIFESRERHCEDNEIGCLYGRNDISDGTEFMREVYKGVKKFIVEKIPSSPVWDIPTVVFDSYLTPGEAEHKISDFINGQRKCNSWNEDFTVCIYSPDSDMIILSLFLHVKNICIISESNPNVKSIGTKFSSNNVAFKISPNDFSFIFVNLLRELFLFIYLDGKQTNLERFIDDFCVLTFFLGNDFFNSFPLFCIRKDPKFSNMGFDDIINLYVRTNFKEGKFILENGEFNYENLGLFLGRVGVEFYKQYQNINDKELIYQMVVNKHLSLSGIKMEEGNNYDDILRKDVFDVLDALNWILKYYLSDCASWSWVFENKIIPSPIIIERFIGEYNPPHFDVGEVPNTYQHLLCVLPSRYAHLLPKALQKFSTDEDSPIYKITHGGPKDIDYAGYMKARELVDSVSDQLTEEEKEFSVIRKPFLCVKENGVVKMVEIDVNKPLRMNRVSKVNWMPSYMCLPVKVQRDNKGAPEGLRVSLPPRVRNPNLRIIKNQLNGKTILVNYPYLVPAVVEDVYKPHEVNVTKNMKNNFLIPNHDGLLVKVRMQCYTDIQSYNKEFEDSLKSFPYEFTLPLEKSKVTLCNNIRFSRRKPVSHIRAIIRKGNYKGRLCIINSINENKLNVQLYNKRPYSTKQNEIINNDSKTWVSINDVSKRINIPTEAIRSALTKIGQFQYNVLLLQFMNGKKMCRNGYAKIENGTIFIIEKLIPLISAYFENIGGLKEVIINSSSATIEKDVEDYIDSLDTNEKETKENANAFTKQVSTWIKENSPINKSSFVECSIHPLSSITMKNLEEELEKFSEPLTLSKEKTVVPADSAIWEGAPLDQYKSTFSRGDRVFYVGYRGLPDFGTSGTVIYEYNHEIYGVVADQEIEWGFSSSFHLSKKRFFIAFGTDLVKE